MHGKYFLALGLWIASHAAVAAQNVPDCWGNKSYNEGVYEIQLDLKREDVTKHDVVLALGYAQQNLLKMTSLSTSPYTDEIVILVERKPSFLEGKTEQEKRDYMKRQLAGIQAAIPGTKVTCQAKERFRAD
jgi:hypothetical protein